MEVRHHSDLTIPLKYCKTCQSGGITFLVYCNIVGEEEDSATGTPHLCNLGSLHPSIGVWNMYA